MKPIDFLPNEYREKYAVRYQRLWRLTVLLVFGGSVAAATGIQLWAGRRIDRRLQQTDADYRVALEHSRELAELYQEIDRRKDRAALVTLLQRQWPLSRLAAGCFRPVDPSIALDSWRLTRHAPKSPTRQPGRKPRHGGRSAARPDLPPARDDLQTLYRELQETTYRIELRGAAKDLSSLYRYLGQLSTAPLFQHVELTRFESEDADGESVPGGRSPRTVVRFQIEIEIRAPTETLPDDDSSDPPSPTLARKE